MSFGVVKFIPFETFQGPRRILGRSARVDTPEPEPVPQNVDGWPQVQIEPVWRNGMFVVDGITDGATFNARLAFCPTNPDAGRYEIHRANGSIERGRSEKIIFVAEDEVDNRMSMLVPFRVRYAVVTFSFERPHPYLVWLVGLTTFRNGN